MNHKTRVQNRRLGKNPNAYSPLIHNKNVKFVKAMRRLGKAADLAAAGLRHLGRRRVR